MSSLFIDNKDGVGVSVGETLLEVSKTNELNIPYSCDGVPACARCKVVIESGEEFLSPICDKEKKLIGNAYFVTKERLACMAKISAEGDIRIKNI